MRDPAKYVHTSKYTLRRTIDHRHEMKKKFLDTYKDSVNAESVFFISALLQSGRLEMQVENLDDRQADKIRPKSDRGGVSAGI
jgi:hypothetical protein